MRAKRRKYHKRRRWMLTGLTLLVFAAALAAYMTSDIWQSGIFEQARALPVLGGGMPHAVVIAAGHADSPDSSVSSAMTGAESSPPPVLPATWLAPPPLPKDEPAAVPPAPATPPEATPEEERRWIALTFDDGPDGKYTPQILDILKEKEAKATFFLVGTQVEKYPEIAKRIVEEGHTIGNHSWSHQNLAAMKPESLDDQVKRTQEAIADATGVEPALMRAPYGALSDGFLDYLHGLNLQHIYWTIDPRDWDGTSVADMRNNITKHAKPGGIILLHSFGGRKHALDHTLELLPLIIEDLRDAGYKFTTVDQMIEAEAVVASAIK